MDEGHDRRFNDAERGMLIHEARRARWDPPRFVEKAGLRAGDVVLDLGCGPGFWTLPMAESVGPTGKVYALDMSPVMLESLVEHNPPGTVITVRSELPVIALPDATVDCVWGSFIFHEVAPLEALAIEVKRVLKPCGRVLVLDWRPDGSSPSGPPRHHRVSPGQVTACLKAAGFTCVIERWRDDDCYLVEGS